MVDSVVFIGAGIIAVTQAVKYLLPQVHDVLTIAVAVAVGVLVALLDTEIGVVDITVAEGVMTALAAVGVHQTARQIG